MIIDRKNNLVRHIGDPSSLSDFERYLLPYLLDSVALRVSRANGRIGFQWPTIPAPTQVQLEYCDQLPTAAWNPVATTPVVTAETTSLSVDESTSGQARFYRLRIVL